ncbi:MAG: hypothetical protein JWO68_2710 [Actinomycetia bacterium]|nr:hypothetical protein [Actinomycetes bacterium]
MIIAIVGDVRSLVLRGLAAVAFGVLALVWPGLTLWALVVLFGAYLLVDGLSTLLGVLTHRAAVSFGPRSLLVLFALVSVAAGLLTLLWPGITALALLFLIAGWAFVTGVLHLVAAVQLRKEITNEWLFVLSGIVSLVFATLLVITPGAGALAITWVIGWLSLLRGVLLLALAWRLHRLEASVRSRGGAAWQTA